MGEANKNTQPKLIALMVFEHIGGFSGGTECIIGMPPANFIKADKTITIKAEPANAMQMHNSSGWLCVHDCVQPPKKLYKHLLPRI